MAQTEHDSWNDRAAAAEFSVVSAFVRRVGPVAWARASAPPREGLAGAWDEMTVWHYWWQAHLVHATVDAARHRPSPGRRLRARALTRGMLVRNAGCWVNAFYDDIAWLGVALERGGAITGGERGLRHITRRLRSSIDPTVGALPWRVGSRLFNAPANGPAAILLARVGEVDAAARLADWLDETLRDEATGLICDGVVRERAGTTVRAVRYTYCQGVALAAQLEVARRRNDGGGRFLERGIALVDAIVAWTADRDGVLLGAGGGDGGLFAGITCRNLAWAAGMLDALAAAAVDPSRAAAAAASARALVLRNAEALWSGRAERGGRPVFSADGTRRAHVPTGASRPGRPRGGAVSESSEPDRDLSVQLGAWLTLEAAVVAHGSGLTASPKAAG